MAGPVERTKLLSMATKIGVGESARFLSGHAEWFLRLGTPGGYNPSRLLGRTGVALAAPASIVEGLHVFTFNQVRQTEEWRRSVLAHVV
jgi:methylenetetrahydrofolate reductase (NADPH)